MYLATHLGTDRPVALKVIAPQFMMNDEFVERFRREAKAAGRLHHPNVVNVTDFGFATVDGKQVAYMVMEYLDGCTLADILEEEATLPIPWIVDIIEQACSALDEAHRLGIVHRDLKPDNLWLEPNRRGGYRVKVLDFGLAKLDAPVLVESSGPLALPAEQRSPTPDGASINQAMRAADLAAGGAYQEKSGADQPTMVLEPDTDEDNTPTRILEPKQTEGGIGGAATAAVPVRAADTVPPSPSGASMAGSIAQDSIAEDKTQILNRVTVRDDQYSTSSTEVTDGLTRVGSVLGTPVYMSPEQCRAEPLDARSDIYSLGVITYQMLAGEPPFKGSMAELMRQHADTPPPPLNRKGRKIPKKLGLLVMLALAKNPADRPQSAAGFASALRSFSEGTGSLLRRAFSLYSENFPKFVKLSALFYLPVIAISILLLILTISSGRASTPTDDTRPAEMLFFAGVEVWRWIATSIVAGVTIRLVAQLNIAPLRPLRVRVALASLKKRLLGLLLTMLMVGILSISGLILGGIPGILFYINSSLVAPVVVMENLRGWQARRRSKSLVRRVKRTAVATILFQILLPAFVGGVVSASAAILSKGTTGDASTMLAARVNSLISLTINMFIVPLIASMTALLYLKARQAAGETLREAMSMFEDEDTPRTRWQMRMRERLSLPTQPGR